MIKRFTLFLMMLFMAGASLQAQTNLFVSASGSDANAGTTWETSKATLRAALTTVAAGGTVFMKAGTYYTNGDTIPAGISVVGGFATVSAGTDTSQRVSPGVHETWENSSHSTILDAQHENRVVYVSGNLENCILRNGYIVGNGGGVYIHGGRVSHCVLIRNRADNDAFHLNFGRGGGAYIDNDGLLVNCVLSYNLAVEGLAVAGNGGQQINNTITQNSAVKGCGTVTDVDNHVYQTVVIGTQCWMKENLRTTRYADSVAIESANYSYSGSYAGNMAVYGLLYSANSFRSRIPQGPCPTGWHVPTSEEVNTLTNYVNSTYQYLYNGTNNSIAKALAANDRWTTSTSIGAPGFHPNGNNATGFSAIPAGGTRGNRGEYAVFWTTSLDYFSYYYSRFPGYRQFYLYYTSNITNNVIDGSCTYGSDSNYYDNLDFASIRCLKDSD